MLDLDTVCVKKGLPLSDILHHLHTCDGWMTEFDHVVSYKSKGCVVGIITLTSPQSVS